MKKKCSKIAVSSSEWKSKRSIDISAQILVGRCHRNTLYLRKANHDQIFCNINILTSTPN